MVNKTEDSVRELLSKPGNEKPQECKRLQAQYEDLTGNFYDVSNIFSMQYCHMYAIRLTELRETLLPRVKAKWGKLYITIMSYSTMNISIHRSILYNET